MFEYSCSSYFQINSPLRRSRLWPPRPLQGSWCDDVMPRRLPLDKEGALCIPFLSTRLKPPMFRFVGEAASRPDAAVSVATSCSRKHDVCHLLVRPPRFLLLEDFADFVPFCVFWKGGRKKVCYIGFYYNEIN